MRYYIATFLAIVALILLLIALFHIAAIMVVAFTNNFMVIVKVGGYFLLAFSLLWISGLVNDKH